MDEKSALGLNAEHINVADERLRRRHFLNINLTLAAAGQPICEQVNSGDFMDVARDVVDCYYAQSRLAPEYLCPADQRIQSFLDAYLGKFQLPSPKLPVTTLVLHRHGIARELSLSPRLHLFESGIIQSYRVRQGILHNTLNDRRTTQGSFHIAAGGFAVPSDKREVPVLAFQRLLQKALEPPREMLRLPFTAEEKEPAEIFVSLLIRPVVCPAVPGVASEKTMEIRFFAPGGAVSNLDFVESIFGNAGNPYLPENDAGLDIEHWSGHTGCVIVAPHLAGIRKKDLGLPRRDEASSRQLADGMYWQDEEEIYNDGKPFKITARDASGVIVTLISDNYFGYCKKEVKTQISFAANLYGLAEEEHAGGALVFARQNHGEEFGLDNSVLGSGYSFAEVKARYAECMELQPEGYGIDRRFPQLWYVPEGTRIDLNRQELSWLDGDSVQLLKLHPDRVYMLPDGYKVQMEKHPAAPSWRLVRTEAEGVFCHKPCTVSGGGKSEISKSIRNTVLFGPVFVADLEDDLDQVEAIFRRDYSDRFISGMAPCEGREHTSRYVLSSTRSLGSVIKLLTPSSRYTPDYNAWLEQIPNRIKSIVFMIKRFYKPEWGDQWRRHFSVDFINGRPGNELKLDGRGLVASNLRVGFSGKASWRVFKLRQDFVPAAKIQTEDDITVSVVVPSDVLPNRPEHLNNPCVKLTHNCEYRLFQRPDEAIHRGLDIETERDLAGPGNFLSNYEALGASELQDLVEDVMGFHQYTPSMRSFLSEASRDEQGYAVSPAHPRLVAGKPSQNPRYLQLRQDIQDEFAPYLAQMGARLRRRVPLHEDVVFPVSAVISGRRNNRPEPGVRPLCVYNPIHYQELPELFMDYICSLTGKSPSTTGAGSEGALTKGPFNALLPTVDLNNALVSAILTGYGGFSSAAGYIGPHLRVDHDVSLLIPEIWSRLPPEANDPAYLIREGHLEPVQDFEYQGRPVLASRLGYRITSHFVHSFLGKVFDAPSAVFDDAVLRPETQDMACFVDGVENIVEAQRVVAQAYLNDGSVEQACPPLKALLYIMATGSYRGMDVQHREIRQMFTRERLLGSDWYRLRLAVKQARDVELWERHIAYLEAFVADGRHAQFVHRLQLQERLAKARSMRDWTMSADYREFLVGTLGADPLQMGAGAIRYDVEPPAGVVTLRQVMQR
ncbi:hypothetical protein [Methyloterricola oryzae]|uniref:hypothetical protein n=1 Tax=Methyloterricola oryzae TaxID=1495050 RepID=UPI0006994FBF|nr:hypothetical protein [Methyloterricola oryzae]